jgi:hypothetical protein
VSLVWLVVVDEDGVTSISKFFMKGEDPSQLTGMSRGKANPNRERDISGSSSQRVVGDTLVARHVRLAHRRFAELQYQVRRTPSFKGIEWPD